MGIHDQIGARIVRAEGRSNRPGNRQRVQTLPPRIPRPGREFRLQPPCPAVLPTCQSHADWLGAYVEEDANVRLVDRRRA